LVEVEVMG